MQRTYELRCPVHGFIPFSAWERDIINHPAFQRLRRIRQLAWTDYIYPGAMHSRFEHSLGVMHIASKLFDAIVHRSDDILKNKLGFSDGDLKRDKQIVRLAALLHDTGHSPFSHAGEENFPVDPLTNKHFKHEAYSAAVIRHVLKDVIDGHGQNDLKITADQVATLLEKGSGAGRRTFWKEIIDGQMDADRMDYLLRDSHHIGVRYGQYDWQRLLNTIQIVEMPVQKGEEGSPESRIGVSEGGVHAAEALVLARYYMFTQVYFHKTRVAYDHHIRHALKAILHGEAFPPPTPERIVAYLKWDDWHVLGRLADGEGGEHGDRIRNRDHYREVYHTSENQSVREQNQLLTVVKNHLGNLVAAVEPSETSAYKLDNSDIWVVSDDEMRSAQKLSQCSSVVKNLNKNPINIVRLYARRERAEETRAKVAELLKESL